MPLDLFGVEIGPPRKTKVQARGYASRPGSGPAGETCRSCANATAHERSRRRYWKCALIKPTSGPGTDIRLKSPACAYWREGPDSGHA